MMESLGLDMGFAGVSSYCYRNMSGPKTVAEANLTLLESRKFVDISFVVGPYKDKFECHQLILMSRSKVLEDVITGLQNAIKVDRNTEIEIPDVEPRAFKLFLQFVYGDKADMSVPDALHVLYVADKYKVEPLVEKCVLLLKQEFDIKDVIQVYESAVKYELLELEKESLDYMAKNFIALAGSFYFSGMGRDTLIALLKRDDLTMDETKIFELVLEWADSQKYKETLNGEPKPLWEILRSVLPHVRFPIMSSKDFAATVVPTGLIPQEDVVALFVYYNSQGHTREELERNLKYCCRPRDFWTPTKAVVAFYEPSMNLMHPDMLDHMRFVNEHEDIFEFLFINEPKSFSAKPTSNRLPAITSVVLSGPNFSSFSLHPAYIARDVQVPTNWKVTVVIEKTFLPDYFGEVTDETGPSVFTKSNVDIYAYMEVDVEVTPRIYLEHNSRYKISVLYQSALGVLPSEVTGWRNDVCTSTRIVQNFKVRHDHGEYSFRPMAPYELPDVSFEKMDVLHAHSIRAIKVSDS